MPEDIKDGVSEVVESAALPKPTFQESSQPAGSELSAEAIAEQKLEQRLKDTEERLRREFQSKYDKDTAANRKLYGDLSEVQKALADVKAGGDPDAIFAAIEQRNLYAKVEELSQKLSAPQQVSQNGNGEAEAAHAKAVGLVTKAGLANDPEVLKMFQGSYKTPADFAYAVSELVLTRNTKTQPAAASATMPAGGRGAQSTKQSVQSELDALIADRNIMLSADGRKKIAEKRAELEQLESQ